MQVDIAAETLKVGNAMASVRIDQMILNLAKGIAWGQYELDKVGVDITKMMGVPGTVSIGGENISMLEAGFIPSFYHFVDTILEIKMEVNIREEQTSAVSTKEATSKSKDTEKGVQASVKGKVGAFEVGVKASYKSKSSSAYSRSVDASHSQKFSQDLSATSLMRTKIVPVPPPELLVERIKILLEKLREETGQGFLGKIPSTTTLLDALNKPEVSDELIKGFQEKLNIKIETNASLKKIESTTTPPTDEWTLENVTTTTGATDTTPTTDTYRIEKAEKVLNVYKVLAPDDKAGQDDLLMQKVESKVLDRLEEIGS